MNYIRYYILVILLGIIVQSCSTTAHLPDDEVLYTGITDISFGPKPQKEKKGDGEGVITAINDAYVNVERVLSGEALPQKELSIEDMTEFQRDSLKAEKVMMDEALNTVKDEVTAVLSIAPNNSLLGSAKYRFPLPVGLWFYNGFVGSKTKVGKWFFNTFSATPKYISTVNPSLRTKVAQNVLHNYGYFRGEVSYDLYMHKRNPRKAKVGYVVLPHQLYRLDSIAYLGFSPQADSLIRAQQRRSLIHRGDPFTAASLDAERQRLNTLFRNNGYYYCQPNLFTYRADTLQRQDWVQLQVVPSRELPEVARRRFYLRNTRIHLVDARRGLVENDSVGRRGNIRMYYAARHEGDKPSVRFGALRRNIFLEKGTPYRQVLSNLTQEKLSELGIFSQVTLDYTPIDTTSTCDSLDVDIHAVLDKPFDAEFKANATTKSNGLVGPGLSFGMTRRNAFHRAEALNFQVYGNYEWQTGSNMQDASSSIMNSYEYGTSLSLDYPYIKLGKLGRNFLRNGITSTSFKLEADWLNRAGYFGRVSFGARVTLSYRRKPQKDDFREGSHKPTIRHEFTPFRLDYDVQLHSTQAFDSIMNANPALNVSMRNQFVPSMQYVMSMTSRRGSRHPGTFTLTLKEAGNVMSGLYACFGQKFSQPDKHLFGVPFAQYVKGVAEFTKAHNIGNGGVQLAGRVMLGAIYSYGNATVAPYSDLFTIGGANSIRAFSVRSIGPGSYRPANGRFSYVDQVGDLKFEANVECRFPIVGDLEGAAFVDCGNVWLMKNNENHPGGAFSLRNLGKELALGTGLGLRYDLDFLIVRFDVGVGIHAPYDTGKTGYYNMTRFGRSLGYHLAIGYPF
ncbi:MAG: BamA/TamA family outer membrane protein [Bacteroidales bacterium]|nr:BamA/TamA family outer membrane protein [Bacteroidales bacterium]